MSKCLVKRFIPFAVALVLGLFVASFFVTVAAPQFNFKRGRHSQRQREVRELRDENIRLREELNQQKRQVEELKLRQTINFENEIETDLPLAPPPPPTVSRRVR